MHSSSEKLTQQQRLADLARLQIMDSAPERSFDDLLELLVQLTACPMAMINFIDDKRVWAKASKGVGFTEAPKALSVCTHTIESDSVLVVEDTLLDPRFSENSFVVCSNGMRFYAGAPVYGPSGAKVGSVCVLDTIPKKCTPEIKQALTIIAHQTSLLLELEEKKAQLALWADERLQLEQATIRRQIQQHEDERELIGYELHENFAQSIAASLQYLSLVRGAADADWQHIGNVRQVLTSLLNSVRQLSSSVFPIGSAGVIREEMFRKFIRQFNQQSNIQVSFVCEGNTWLVPPAKLLTLFRIMVEQLYVYELQGSAALQVNVTLCIAADVQLDITAEGAGERVQTWENQVVENSIFNRSKLQNGKMYTSMKEGKSQVLTVHLPL